MLNDTALQFDQVASLCRKVFVAKLGDYSPVWRIFRLPSLTDQIYIKAERIRSLQQKGQRMVDEDIDGEFMGIVNYSVMALIQIQLGVADRPDLHPEAAIKLYDHHLEATKTLMLKKNHDYGEAWRNMRVSSLVDIILVKLFRIKEIEDNGGKTSVSEGIDANYADIINYAVFALIKITLENEQTNQSTE
ncbi:MAG: DUF1599 domain-containing protein [Bacteroidales bacterium]|nr:DUF1599 domain-containing protein [Bacteroidales bacterium]